MTGKGELKIIGDYVWDRTFAQTVDRLTAEQFKIPAMILMENAGRGLAQAILEIGVEDAPVLVLAGSGNNGGDALVAARYLAEAGAAVHIFLVPHKPDAQPSVLTATHVEILKALRMQATVYRPGLFERFKSQEAIIVDGVFGLGFNGDFEEGSLPYEALKEAASLVDATVVAVDVPSGLDVDQGDKQEVPLPADVTVTFGGKKLAHVLSPARDACGDVINIDIGFPQAAQDAALGVHRPALVLADPQELIRDDPWSALPRSAHKFDRGHVLIIGGSAGKTGAPILAAMAALRAGAGWATVAMPDSATATLRGDVPREITFEALFDGEKLNAITLAKFLDERNVRSVVAGPGAVLNPLSPEVLAVLADFTGDGEGFVVIDAGATAGLATILANLDADPEKWILTPHPGEWAKLGAEFDFSPLTAAGLKKANMAAERLGVALLYKHATPLLVTGNPKAPGFVSAEGTLALARAGSGDILSGVIGAHGAQGLTTVPAALRSQVVVAWAAALAADDVGEHAVLASDILAQIGNVSSLAIDEDDDDDDDGDDEDENDE